MVKHRMDLIIVTALSVQCGYEVLSPLGTCLGPRSALTTAIPSIAVIFLGGTRAVPFVTMSGCQSTPLLFGSSSSISNSLLLSVLGRSCPLAVNKARGKDANPCWPMPSFKLTSGVIDQKNQHAGK